ncbi:MAG: PTS IIA-like nitrogen regulatory protein PtsN [Pseudomonadota bacterium]|nr:PTS IIA-like nitrogen regulatory protein PtsN [Pseudomonadota bacterium]
MEIEDILELESVVTCLKATSKKQALEELSDKASKTIGQTEQEIFDVLLERERLGTTGVGDGIAIPHGKIAGLNRLFGIFARLESPIQFDAVDGQPVDLIFLLLAPESASAAHLKILSRISRVLRDHSKCEKLRTAPTPEKIYSLLTRHTQNRAA